MKKIAYLVIALILLINMNACSGYKPIFSSTNLQFEIADHSIEGNIMLGNQIYSKLYNISKLKKDNENVKSVSIFIKVAKDQQATSKDSAGKILEYRIILNTTVEIKDFLTDEKIISQIFSPSTTYKVQNQFSDTLKLENRSVNNLIDKIYQNLLITLSEKL